MTRYGYEYDENIDKKLITYLQRTVNTETKQQISETYIAGSLAKTLNNEGDSYEGGFNIESDVDVFFVLNEWDLPRGDISMVCMANVDVAVRNGLERQPGESWGGQKYWGEEPESAIEELPRPLLESVNRIIGSNFSTDKQRRFVDVFFGNENQLKQHTTHRRKIDFP